MAIHYKEIMNQMLITNPIMPLLQFVLCNRLKHLNESIRHLSDLIKPYTCKCQKLAFNALLVNKCHSTITVSARKFSSLPFYSALKSREIGSIRYQFAMCPMKLASLRETARNKEHFFLCVIAQPSANKPLYLLNCVLCGNLLNIILITT